MTIGIVYVTARREPRVDWIVDGIEAQALPGDAVHLVVVDALGSISSPTGRARSARELGVRPTPALTEVSVVEPKPTPWQGAHRLTRDHWWAVASARNTGIVLLGRDVDYVAFLDDRCRLGSGWLAAVRRGAAQRASVLAGTYSKIEGAAGRLTRTIDHRRQRSPGGLRGCGGGWLYGCTVALPLAWCLEVNGFEEGCDGLGGEDYIFGMMLSRRGRRVDFVVELAVEQDRTDGTSHELVRVDKGTSPRDKSHAAIDRFGCRSRTEWTPDLAELRRAAAEPGWIGWPAVDPAARDWYDGQPIRDMTP